MPPQMVTSTYTTIMAAFGDTPRPGRADGLACSHLSRAATFYLMGGPPVSPAIGQLRLGRSPNSRTMLRGRYLARGGQ
jgi:hypothetical protein